MFQKLYHRNFQNILVIMKKFLQLNCIAIGLEVLDDGPNFFGTACCQERCSIVCKNRQPEEAKTKVYIFVYKILINSIFKSYTGIAMGFHALPKWSHYKVKLLQNSIISVLVILPSDIVPSLQTRSVLRPRTVLRSTDSKNSCCCLESLYCLKWTLFFICGGYFIYNMLIFVSVMKFFYYIVWLEIYVIWLFNYFRRSFNYIIWVP